MIKQSWKVDLDLLTPKQLTRYDDSLEVLRLMRTGISFSKATDTVGSTPSTTKNHLGNSLFKRKNRIRPKKNDILLRKIRINEKGKEVFIQIRGNKRVKVIAQYQGAIGQAIDQNNFIKLKSFRKRRIKDIDGKFHSFETDISKIQLIILQREEPEFFTIYQRSS